MFALLAAFALASAAPAANRANAAVTGSLSLQAASGLGQSDSCPAGPQSVGYGTPLLGITAIFQRGDRACARIRKAKALQGFGFNAAAVQVMCGDREVRAAMQRAGTPCDGVREAPLRLPDPAAPDDRGR